MHVSKFLLMPLVLTISSIGCGIQPGGINYIFTEQIATNDLKADFHIDYWTDANEVFGEGTGSGLRMRGSFFASAEIAPPVSIVMLSSDDKLTLQNTSVPESSAVELDSSLEFLLLQEYHISPVLPAKPGDILTAAFLRTDETKQDSFATFTIPNPPVLTPDNLSGQTFTAENTVTVNWTAEENSTIRYHYISYCIIDGHDNYFNKIVGDTADTGEFIVDLASIERTVSFTNGRKLHCDGNMHIKFWLSRLGATSHDNQFESAFLNLESSEKYYNFTLSAPTL